MILLEKIYIFISDSSINRLCINGIYSSCIGSTYIHIYNEKERETDRGKESVCVRETERERGGEGESERYRQIECERESKNFYNLT